MSALFSSLQGIYGALIKEDFDIIGNMFIMLSDRLVTTSFPFPIVEQSIQLYYNQSLVEKSLDWTFFTRPFHFTTWICVIICLTLHTTLSFLRPKTVFQKLVIFNAWIFYVSAFAYYSGVQTMFFSSPQYIHLNSVLDVLNNKDWNLVLSNGYTIFVDQYASNGITEFQNLQNQLKRGYVYKKQSIEVRQNIEILNHHIIQRNDILYRMQFQQLDQNQEQFLPLIRISWSWN